MGKRIHATAWDFVSEVRDRILGRPQITTDGFRPYIGSIDDAFGADVDYAYLVKTFGSADPESGTYAPPRITAVFHQEVFGNPDPRYRYNFGRVHSSLRVTPAMEAGLTDHVWNLEEIMAS